MSDNPRDAHAIEAMSGETPPARPSRPWQMGSALTMSTVGAISRGFLYGLNTTEVHGLDRFLGLLDQRADVGARQRGLVTVSNHVSVYARRAICTSSSATAVN